VPWAKIILYVGKLISCVGLSQALLQRLRAEFVIHYHHHRCLTSGKKMRDLGLEEFVPQCPDLLSALSFPISWRKITSTQLNIRPDTAITVEIDMFLRSLSSGSLGCWLCFCKNFVWPSLLFMYFAKNQVSLIQIRSTRLGVRHVSMMPGDKPTDKHVSSSISGFSEFQEDRQHL
jgi:hypothetical protein